MKISLTWDAPIPLRGEARDLCDSFDFDVLPDEAGVYIFARRFGSKISAVYVGKAEVLRVLDSAAVEQQPPHACIG